MEKKEPVGTISESIVVYSAPAYGFTLATCRIKDKIRQSLINYALTSQIPFDEGYEIIHLVAENDVVIGYSGSPLFTNANEGIYS